MALAQGLLVPFLHLLYTERQAIILALILATVRHTDLAHLHLMFIRSHRSQALCMRWLTRGGNCI